MEDPTTSASGPPLPPAPLPQQILAAVVSDSTKTNHEVESATAEDGWDRLWLPYELVELIMTFLTPAGLARAEMVCRQWLALATDTATVWRTVYINAFGGTKAAQKRVRTIEERDRKRAEEEEEEESERDKQQQTNNSGVLAPALQQQQQQQNARSRAATLPSKVWKDECVKALRAARKLEGHKFKNDYNILRWGLINGHHNFLKRKIA